MKEITRRTALGSVAASAFVGLGAKVVAGDATPRPMSDTPRPMSDTPRPAADTPQGPVKPMTLDEFRRTNGPDRTDDLFTRVDGHTFSMCHKEMREKHGIWIPELVPVFEKMDAMRASGG